MTLGEKVIEAVVRANAVSIAGCECEGVVFVWAPNSPEQIEAALAEIEWEQREKGERCEE